MNYHTGHHVSYRKDGSLRLSDGFDRQKLVTQKPLKTWTDKWQLTSSDSVIESTTQQRAEWGEQKLTISNTDQRIVRLPATPAGPVAEQT